MTYHSKQSIIKGDDAKRLRVPIYYLEIEMSFYKTKSWIKKDTWLITFVEEDQQILEKDELSKSFLEKSIYGNKYKGQRGIRIERVKSRKRIGQTNW